MSTITKTQNLHHMIRSKTSKRFKTFSLKKQKKSANVVRKMILPRILLTKRHVFLNRKKILRFSFKKENKGCIFWIQYSVNLSALAAGCSVAATAMIVSLPSSQESSSSLKVSQKRDSRNGLFARCTRMGHTDRVSADYPHPPASQTPSGPGGCSRPFLSVM